MMNVCVFSGNLGRDPEIKTLPSGDRMATVTLAVNERYTDRQGVKQERTTWVRVVVFGFMVDRLEAATKGWRCLVVGKLEERKFTDATGVERSLTEVVVRGGMGGIEVGEPLRQGQQRPAAVYQESPSSPSPSNSDDDVPW